MRAELRLERRACLYARYGFALMRRGVRYKWEVKEGGVMEQLAAD